MTTETTDKNVAILNATVNAEATTALLAQQQPLHMYEVFAQKTSHKGVSVGFIAPRVMTAATKAEVEREFAAAVGTDALRTDAVGVWQLCVTQVA